MKKLLFPFVLTALLLAGACNQKSTTSTSTSSDTKAMDNTKADKAVNIKLNQLATTTDLACGMPLEEGAVADTASFAGKTYGFCSAECKANFMKNPQSFLDKK